MHEQLTFRIAFNFGDIVSHVINQLHAQFLSGRGEDVGKRLANGMRNDLPVGKGHVGRTIHGREVILPFRRTEGGTGQLLIVDGNIVPSHRLFKYFEIVAGDLMTKAAGTTVNHDDDLILAGNPERRGRCGIENPLIGGDLDFKVMIARPQRPQLIDSTPQRLIGHRRRIGSADATAFFDPRKILMPSIALFDAPTRTFQHDASEFAPIEPDRSSCADTGWHAAEELRHQTLQARLHVH